MLDEGIGTGLRRDAVVEDEIGNVARLRPDLLSQGERAGALLGEPPPSLVHQDGPQVHQHLRDLELGRQRE